MDNTEISLKNSNLTAGTRERSASATIVSTKGQRTVTPFSVREVATSTEPLFLTTYKKVVDNLKTYGLTAYDLTVVREKLRLQNNFLEFSYITNDQTGQKFTLKD